MHSQTLRRVPAVGSTGQYHPHPHQIRQRTGTSVHALVRIAARDVALWTGRDVPVEIEDPASRCAVVSVSIY